MIGQIPSFYWYPHSLIVASARFVLSPEYRQYHSARDQAEDATVLLSIIAPYAPRDPLPQNHAAENPAYQRVVADFAKAFKINELNLQREANLEGPIIENAYKKLSSVKKCRP